MPETTGDVLYHVAHLGVLMLLFTVGLKLKLGQLVQPQVIGGGLLHFAFSVGIFTPGIHFVMGLDWNTSLLPGIALTFSSTVLAAKILEGKRGIGAFHGQVAIGILIIQDIIALAVIVIWGGETPSIWALWILALPLLRPILHWLLDLTRHDELLVLMGMLLALVIGGMGFEVVGASPEIGALLMGVLLASHQRAKEMSDALWSLKEVLLVGFFLLILFRLRARNAFIAAVVLAMDDIESKLIAARQLRAKAFRGPIVSHALHEDHVERITAAGADQTYLTMHEAGVSLAEHAWQALNPEAAPGSADG